MAERLGDAILELRTDDRRLRRGLRDAERGARGLERTFKRVGASIAAAVSVNAIGRLVASTVRAASEVEEMGNLMDVTFGEASEDVREWSEITAEAVNRSRFELQRFAGDFAAFLKPLGVAPAAIRPMAQELTQLTVDLASFRNLAEADVFTALFSGLAGETEAVRRLGIDLGAAAIEQELLRQGIEKTNAEATQSEKVMARFALIMRDTADAQGDAARTSDSFSNRSRELQAALLDLRVEVGERLLPKFNDLLGRLIEFARSDEAEQAASDLAGAVSDLAGAVIDLTEAVQSAQPVADFLNSLTFGPDPERLRQTAAAIEAIERFLTLDLGRATGAGQTAIAGRIRQLADEVELAGKKFVSARSDFDLSFVLSEAEEAISGLTDDQLKRIGEEAGAAAAATSDLEGRLEALAASGDSAQSRLEALRKQHQSNLRAIRDSAEIQENFAEALRTSTEELASQERTLKVLQDALDDLDIPSGDELFGIPDAPRAATEFEQSFKQSINNIADDLTRSLIEAVRSGDVDAAIDAFVDALARAVSQAVGDAVSEAIGGVTGEIAGGAIGGLTGFFVSLIPEALEFGSRRAERAANAVSLAFGDLSNTAFELESNAIGAAEGLQELNAAAADMFTRLQGALRGALEDLGVIVGETFEPIITEIREVALEGGKTGFLATVGTLEELEQILGEEFVPGIQDAFETLEEAIGFVTREFILGLIEQGAQVDQAVEELARSENVPLSQFADALKRVQSLADQARISLEGFSQIEIDLQKLPAQLASLRGELQQLGLSAAQVERLVGGQLVASLQAMRQQITGEELSIEQRKAIQVAQAELFNAERALRIAELETRRAALHADLGLTRAEIELIQAGTKSFAEALKAKGKAYDAEVRLIVDQIKAINQILKSLAKIPEINIGTLRLPGVPRIRTDLGGVGRGIRDVGDAAAEAARELERAIDSLRGTIGNLRDFRIDLLTGDTQPAARRILVAQREASRAFRAARAGGGQEARVDDFIEAQRALVDIARSTFGSAAGFQSIFQEAVGRTEELERLFGRQLDDLLKPPAEQTAENTSKIAEEAQRGREATERVAGSVNRIEAETKESSQQNQIGHGKTQQVIAEFDKNEKRRNEELIRRFEAAIERSANKRIA